VPYDSIDKLQKALQESVFKDAAAPKKAAGRALGTFVELITLYLLRTWGLRDALAIERRVPEYAYEQIRHNVEFSLHPHTRVATITLPLSSVPITASKLHKAASKAGVDFGKGAIAKSGSGTILETGQRSRNACVFYNESDHFYTAWINSLDNVSAHIDILRLALSPLAVLECKRVGVEEGQKRGPQTIEKAKQGAYVARTVSSLQRFRRRDGSVAGLIEDADGKINMGDYYEMLKGICARHADAVAQRVVLSVGIVSNHGNWFDKNHDPHKEMRVLSQSYDWLLFLSDAGLSKFINDACSDTALNKTVRKVFQASYSKDAAGKKSKNAMTKVTIDLAADAELATYFRAEQRMIKSWFSVVSPDDSTLDELEKELMVLSDLGRNRA
jgi:hypothetical protein